VSPHWKNYNRFDEESYNAAYCILFCKFTEIKIIAKYSFRGTPKKSAPLNLFNHDDQIVGLESFPQFRISHIESIRDLNDGNKRPGRNM
jgi:hypothetical protein